MTFPPMNFCYGKDFLHLSTGQRCSIIGGLQHQHGSESYMWWKPWCMGNCGFQLHEPCPQELWRPCPNWKSHWDTVTDNLVGKSQTDHRDGLLILGYDSIQKQRWCCQKNVIDYIRHCDGPRHNFWLVPSLFLTLVECRKIRRNREIRQLWVIRKQW